MSKEADGAVCRGTENTGGATMQGRPALNRALDADTFRNFYYLKEELIMFCRQNGLPVSGGKRELTDRIGHFLATGEVLSVREPARARAAIQEITLETPIETPFVCSEQHRAFFRAQIERGFSFNVGFQKWLKANTGKTYAEAVAAYHEILAQKKREKQPIDSQFEYNTYIRDFFAHNPGRPLREAIACWKWKKSRPGHNRYEPADLVALDTRGAP